MLDAGSIFGVLGLDAFEDSFDSNDSSAMLERDSDHGLGESSSLDEMFLAQSFSGEPEVDASSWMIQESNTSCAIASQRSVIEEITGRSVTEDELTRIATENGWYDSRSGTSPEHMDDLLVYFDVPCRNETGLSLTDLYHALEAGEHVLVALDAMEIWHPFMGVEQPDAGHAVGVTGLGFREDGTLYVILNDPGRPDGAGFEVAAEDFLNAWDDFGNRAVITELRGEQPDV